MKNKGFPDREFIFKLLILLKSHLIFLPLASILKLDYNTVFQGS